MIVKFILLPVIKTEMKDLIKLDLYFLFMRGGLRLLLPVSFIVFLHRLNILIYLP